LGIKINVLKIRFILIKIFKNKKEEKIRFILIKIFKNKKEEK